MEYSNKSKTLNESKVTYFLPVVFGQSAWYQHIPFAYWLIEKVKPNSYLEMGVHNGVSYFAVCESIRQMGLSTKCLALDHWLGDSQAGFFSDDVFERFAKNNEQYSEFSAYKKNSFEKSMSEIEDDSIDLIHIDGFHSYSSVKNDFELALNKINKSVGIILMHDVNEYQVTFGVNKFWNEIENRFKTFKFNHGHGLGVVFVGTNIESNFLSLFDEKDSYFSNILRNFFEILGQRIFLFAENERLNESSLQANKEIQNLNQSLQARERDIERMKNQFEIDLLRITNSFSWKVTYPIRRLSRFVNRTK
jgi:hypothetical protein